MDGRALFVLCGAAAVAAALTIWFAGDPLTPAKRAFDPDAPTHPVDVAPPQRNLLVATLSDVELAARGITRQSLGPVAFPSGAIVAADPVVQPERPAFARKIKPGRYDISLFKAQQRNALIVLRIAPGTPAHWQLALIPGQDARSLKSDEIFGYPVDAGLGTLMDVVARDALMKRDRQEQERPGSHYASLYDDVVAGPLDAAGGTAVLLKPLADDPAIVPIVQSGWGDGFYASCWGLDARGEPLLLVTDFGVLNDGEGHPPKTP